jgi:ergothioneine biosynthesis protein EgtB
MSALTENVSASVLMRYTKSRDLTMDLVYALSAEDMMIQSCPEASPVKWHLAHTTWFFETFVLSEFVTQYEPFDTNFRWLFNSYYNSLGDMPEKQLRSSFSRPPLNEIVGYRGHVDRAIRKLLNEDPEDEALKRIVLGIEHEQQHQELIVTDIKHALFTNPLHPSFLERTFALLQPTAPKLGWRHYDGGLVEIGVPSRKRAADEFAFDNESPRHKFFLEPFHLATRLVTSAEYLAFIEDKGYERPELWLSEGFAQIRANQWRAPLYWFPDTKPKSGWSIYTMWGTRPLEELLQTPVCHVSFFEADAYARWAGHRLPTEFEWEHAAAELDFESGNDNPGGHCECNLLERALFHPQPAHYDTGLQQIFGDVWEWTGSPYTGYPGYCPLRGALGEYNGKFMSSQMVLRGGSCATPESQIRATYRNFFSPATRWQFSGIRLAKRLSD